MSKNKSPMIEPKEQEKDHKSSSSATEVEEPSPDVKPEDASLKKLQDDLADTKDKYLRLYAEFENHRRRTAQEKMDLIYHANEKLLTALLPVLDDFERAEKANDEDEEKNIEGFYLIRNKLCKALEQFEVKEMDLAIGADFDPDIHEAVTKIPTDDEKLRGKVVDITEKGYTLRDKVIRYPKVVIGE